MNKYMVAAILVCAVILLIGIAWVSAYHKKTEHTLQLILDKLDQALAGSAVDTAYDESMDSAISERLNQVVQIAGMQRDTAREERDSIKSLISDISHQVRTPLANIMLYSGLLSEQKLNGNAKLYAEKIQTQSDKLDFFMKELVKSSITVQEMIVLAPQMVSISNLMEAALQTVELFAMKKNIEINCKEMEGECYADIKWTVEAISNILENAIKYSMDASTIEIQVQKYDSFLCMEVSDHGIGIAEEEQGLIFQKFYRSQQVKDVQGFGIGLYLVREVMQKEGGYVKVKSTPGEGSCFQIYLSRYHM